MLSRMKRLVALLLVLACGSLWGQGLAPAPPPNSRMTTYAAEREQTIAPALEAMRKADYAGALAMFETVLPLYPRDARVLMFAGRAAHGAGDDKKALGFFQVALDSEPRNHPLWGLHMEIVPLYAAAGDWEGFDRERTKIREAVKANTPFFEKLSGYVIENIHEGDKTIRVLEFPLLNGRFHTRYRFILPASASGPAWNPYIDCESDDNDQGAFAKAHPDLAAKGDRSFSLDGYLAPNTHSTIMLFGDGEPTYETVRALVVKHAPPIATTVRQ